MRKNKVSSEVKHPSPFLSHKGRGEGEGEAEGLEERCHEIGCGKPLPRGKSLRAWYCQTIGLCRYCYGHKYPTRRKGRQTPVKPEGKQLLSWSERRYLERAGFNEDAWTPEFRKEMHDSYEARMRGEY